ncbi:MAG: helix-turn-helix domain-containing protein [Planctomycetaceae bacterium]|nr:helix-turn-helix domain-containing protein [Planctomycetaceae bacterium]
MCYLSAADLSQRYALCEATLLRLAKSGRFPTPIKVGRQYRFNPAEVAAWERRQRETIEPMPMVIETLPSEEVTK